MDIVTGYSFCNQFILNVSNISEAVQTVQIPRSDVFLSFICLHSTVIELVN